jgi:predicted O-methyltransferase YrrM
MLSTFLKQAPRIGRGLYSRFSSILIGRAMRRRRLDGAGKIPTFTVKQELVALFALANQSRVDARVLEVGSYLGASTCYIAAGLRGEDFSITCVDTWQNETMPDGVRDTFEEFSRNVEGVKARLRLIRKPSGEVSPQELGEPFDMVFLDGDHSYRQTHQDFHMVSGLVAEGGVLAFHDSLFFQGVSRVIGEALATGAWQIGGIANNLFWIKRAQFVHPS